MCVLTWHDCIGESGAICLDPSTPDWVMHVRTPFGLHGTDVERPHIDVHGRYVLHVDNGHVQCINCTWWEVVMVNLPPIDWVVKTRYHLPT
jgi:hypothetical protein